MILLLLGKAYQRDRKAGDSSCVLCGALKCFETIWKTDYCSGSKLCSWSLTRWRLGRERLVSLPASAPTATASGARSNNGSCTIPPQPGFRCARGETGGTE